MLFNKIPIIRPTDLQAIAGTDPDRLRWYRSMKWLPPPPLTMQHVFACYTAGKVRFSIPTSSPVKEVLMLTFGLLTEWGVPRRCESGPLWLIVEPWERDGMGPFVTMRDGPPPRKRYKTPDYDPRNGWRNKHLPPSDLPHCFDLAETWATVKKRASDLLDMED